MDDDPETLECFEHGSYDILQERFTALRDILPSHKKVIYTNTISEIHGDTR